MMAHKLKFAAVAAISLLGLSIEATPATAGGSPVIVQPMPVYSSCSCCCTSYGPGYGVGYGVGYAPGYGGGYGVGYAPGYGGGYGAGYGPGYYGGAIVEASIVGPPIEGLPTEDTVVVSIGGATARTPPHS